jgi:hypothetical protein
MLVLGSFFQSSTDQKKHVKKKQNFEIYSAASSGGQGKHVLNWPALNSALAIISFDLFVKNIF